MIKLKNTVTSLRLQVGPNGQMATTVHDAFAAHAYQQAIKEHRQVARDDADWIESRAAEILKELTEEV